MAGTRPDRALTKKALAEVVGGLPGGGEPRAGQLAMAEAVATALSGSRHLVVQAGTGTGKSLAYLVPALMSGKKVVVATATKALQDQLATKDLPLVCGRIGAPASFAVLKGRSNYVCRQRVSEILGGEQADLGLEGPASATSDPERGTGTVSDPQALWTESGARSRRSFSEPQVPWAHSGPAGGGSFSEPQVRRILRWSETHPTGDRAELDFEPSVPAWASVSVSSQECPGAQRCPSGEECFAEEARMRAAEADVIVVNMHLYGAHLASGGAVLPEHDVVVFDEAHQLEDVFTACLGHEVSGRRLRALARGMAVVSTGAGTAGGAGAAAGGVAPGRGAPAGPSSISQELTEAADRLDSALAALVGKRADRDGDDALWAALEVSTRRVTRALSSLRAAGAPPGSGPRLEGASSARATRVLIAAGHLAEDLLAISDPQRDQVIWVEGTARAPVLRAAPVEVGPLLAEALWGNVTAVLTSATIPPNLSQRLGIRHGETDELDVGSPFPYATNGLLYCAADLPDRRREGADEAVHEELAALIAAAGGRTLALFTSWAAMRRAAEALQGEVPYPILTQADLPKPALVEAFSSEEAACLFATMGFWQGVDVPGPTLSLVVIDRIPFPRPDDPVLQARRDRAGAGAFRTVDLPRAATLLAQGAGRLIRSSDDRGVVAVLDPRLAKASYRWELVMALPPMPRTRHRSEVEAFLAKSNARGR